MTAAAPLVACHDCHRPLRREPLWMLGQPFGPKCGKRYGLKAERRVRVKRPKETGMEHQPVLDGLEEINEENEEPT